jgi:hypothetical protein
MRIMGWGNCTSLRPQPYDIQLGSESSRGLTLVETAVREGGSGERVITHVNLVYNFVPPSYGGVCGIDIGKIVKRVAANRCRRRSVGNMRKTGAKAAAAAGSQAGSKQQQ